MSKAKLFILLHTSSPQFPLSPYDGWYRLAAPPISIRERERVDERIIIIVFCKYGKMWKEINKNFTFSFSKNIPFFSNLLLTNKTVAALSHSLLWYWADPLQVTASAEFLF